MGQAGTLALAPTPPPSLRHENFNAENLHLWKSGENSKLSLLLVVGSVHVGGWMGRGGTLAPELTPPASLALESPLSPCLNNPSIRKRSHAI